MVGWREDIAFRLKHTGRRLVLEVHLIKAIGFAALHVGLHYTEMNREIYWYIEIILEVLLIAKTDWRDDKRLASRFQTCGKRREQKKRIQAIVYEVISFISAQPYNLIRTHFLAPPGSASQVLYGRSGLNSTTVLTVNNFNITSYSLSQQNGTA